METIPATFLPLDQRHFSAAKGLSSHCPPPGFTPYLVELKRTVNLLDKNGDGKVWEEDLDMLMQLAFGLKEDELRTESWQRVKDGCMCFDGLLSLEAVLNALESGLIQGELSRMFAGSFQSLPFLTGSLGPYRTLYDLVEAFNNFDCDGNGVICAKDLKEALLKHTGVPFTVEECKDLIRRIDGNFDGVVELTEFGALMSFLSRS